MGGLILRAGYLVWCGVSNLGSMLFETDAILGRGVTCCTFGDACWGCKRRVPAKVSIGSCIQNLYFTYRQINILTLDILQGFISPAKGLIDVSGVATTLVHLQQSYSACDKLWYAGH